MRARRLTPFISIALLAGALWVLHRELATHHVRDIGRAIALLPRTAVLGALALTAVSYIVLPAYDALALRYLGRSVGVARTLLTGFTAYAFSQSLGFPLLTGGSIRYRFYAAWGLSSAEIGQLIAFASLTLWLGALAVGGVALATASPIALAHFPLPIAATRGLGVLAAAVPLSYALVCLLHRGPITVRGWEIPVPSPRLVAAQGVLGVADWLVAATVLWVLMPWDNPPSVLAFVGVFVVAQLLGVASHVPGGLGVFESLVLLLLKGDISAPRIVGSLVVYRVIYYLLPFAVAAAGLAAYELRERRERVARVAQAAARWVPPLVPRLLAVTIFAGGSILLFSGALPAEGSRLGWLGDLVPLSVIEVSHFVGSLAGLGLLILAWGIWHRLDGAFHAAVGLLGAGIAASLLKGLDYEEALVLSTVLLALLAARHRFTRHASLVHAPFSAGWIVAVGTVVVTSVWLGMFSFRHVPYRTELWWRFALDGDAPRFLRATVGVLAGSAAFALVRLFRTVGVGASGSTPADLDALAPALALATRTYGSLALMGDKSLLMSPSGNAFVMYGVSGRSWIALGDPVGAVAEYPGLVWDFRELVDRHDGHTVFYQAAPEHLPLYLDLGLRPLKIGEEALVPLATFSLDCPERRGLRRIKRHVEAAGARFALLSTIEVDTALAELRAVSDAWLADRATREKGFSMGRFDPTYVRRFRVAVLRTGDRIAAFATVAGTTARTELSIDLMRHTPDAPEGAMAYLFLELMEWGRNEGYERFSLGMAPLSGIEGRALAPLWSRVNALIFRHAEPVYRFQGLRQFKDKFAPVWSPRYLVAPGGFALPRVLTDLVALISGGLKGAVAR